MADSGASSEPSGQCLAVATRQVCRGGGGAHAGRGESRSARALSFALFWGRLRQDLV